MNSWDFWSVVGLLGISQAILLLILLATNRKNYFLPNIFIVLLLLWIAWLQLEFLVIRRSFVIQNSFFFGSRHGVWFLLGPVVYHYLLTLFGKMDHVRWKTWLHYVPFLLFGLIFPLTGMVNISGRVIGYGMLSVLKFPILVHSWLDILYGYIFILQFVHASAYLLLSVYTIAKFQKTHRQSSSDNRQETLSMLKSLLAAMSLSTMASVVFIVVLLSSRWYTREMDYVYILPLTFCVYLLSYFAIQHPFLFRNKIPVPQRYLQSGLEKADAIKHFEKLKALILQEKLYLNPELRLGDLSDITGTSHHQISEVINTQAGVSFFEFINQFRINEVLLTLKSKSGQHQRINILEIAYASGFNNKVSFNRYFKKQTGQTPSDFIRKKLQGKG